jgi:aspartyl protease family protein
MSSRPLVLPRLHAAALALSSLAAVLVLTTTARADEAEIKARLAAKGIRVTKAALALTEEVELAKAFADAGQLKRKLTLAAKQVDAAERNEEGAQEAMRQVMRDNIDLNTQLSRTGRGNPFAYNQLVAAVNANQSRINLLITERQQAKKEIDEIRQSANSAREKYVQRLLEIRTLVDRLEAKYAELAKNKEALAAVDAWNAAAQTSFKLEPSRQFLSGRKRLEMLEKSVVTDNISLRREGNSFFASVVIGRDHAREMIVDSGASLMMLPHQVALDCGVTVDEADPEISIVIANGQRIKGRLTKLDSVRVGKFEAKDVSCAVLGPEARGAQPLLGMSFLGRFNFELNAQGSRLSLMKLDTETTGAKTTSGGIPRARKKSVPRPPRPGSSD